MAYSKEPNNNGTNLSRILLNAHHTALFVSDVKGATYWVETEKVVCYLHNRTIDRSNRSRLEQKLFFFIWSKAVPSLHLNL